MGWGATNPPGKPSRPFQPSYMGSQPPYNIWYDNMNITIGTILLATLISCMPLAGVDAEPQTFPGGFRGDKFPITTIIESPEDIRARAKRMGFVEWRRAGGLATVSDDLSQCIIYVPPLNGLTLVIWEAELKHCRLGQYHDPNLTY